MDLGRKVGTGHDQAGPLVSRQVLGTGVDPGKVVPDLVGDVLVRHRILDPEPRGEVCRHGGHPGTRQAQAVIRHAPVTVRWLSTW